MPLLPHKPQKTITVTFGELMDRWGMSDEVCEILGLNPWCLNEGRASKNDTEEVTWEQAQQMGIGQHEFESRSKS